MESISGIDSNTLVILSTVISLVIADNNDPADLETIGNFLTAVADLILLKAGQLEHQAENNDRKKKIADLEEQIRKLK